MLAAYNELVPAFERLFEREGGDFERFYAEVRRLAALAARPSAAPRSRAKLAATPISLAHRSTTMADIHIHRDHHLGLAKARKIALAMGRGGRGEVRHGVHDHRGRDEDMVEFKRAGVERPLVVAADHFDLEAKLGFLLGAFREPIEAEIEKHLDALLAGASRKPREGRKAGREDAPRRRRSDASAALRLLQRFDQVDVRLHRLVLRLALELVPGVPLRAARPCR